MDTYSTEKQIAFDVTPAYRSLTVKTNGGRLEVRVKIGEDYILTDEITRDCSVDISTSRRILKFTPLGGAVFSISKFSRGG